MHTHPNDPTGDNMARYHVHRASTDNWRPDYHRHIVKLDHALEPIIDETTARKVAARQGLITEWRILGPYAGGIDRVFEPQIRQGLDEYPRRPFGRGAEFAKGSAATGQVEAPPKVFQAVGLTEGATVIVERVA